MQQQTSFDLARARVCVVMNPGSGKQDGDALTDLLERELPPRVAEFALYRAATGADLPRLARKAVAEDFDLIVAAGGDGTQAAVAGELAGTEAVMGVIPAGTFNFFARELGVGENPEQGLETLLAGRPATVHVGDINGLVFLNNVSFGAYPKILQRREDTYRRWGRSRVAAYWSVIAALVNMRHPMRLLADDGRQERHFRTALAFVANSAYQLDAFGLDGAEAVRSGHFALLIAKANRPVALIGAALRLAFGKAGRDSDFDLIVTDRITIETRPNRQLIAHDGEKTRMTGPFHLAVRRDALKVLLPLPKPEKTDE